MLSSSSSLSKQPNNEEIYISDLSTEKRNELAGKVVVSIDPNKGDLIYAVNSADKTQLRYRYTNMQRRKEKQSPRYDRICRFLKTKTYIEGQNICEWEGAASQFSKKTLDFAAFKIYVQHKNVLNWRLATFYQQYIFRKLQLSAYIRTQISEARMLNTFKEKFGTPEDVVICMGDWGGKGHLKYHAPTVKGKGFRELFRKAGYEVFLVNEFRTSCRCSYCQDEIGVCSTFRHCINPRPWKNNIILRHGLVRCDRCHRRWNRDVNAASNIWRIASSELLGQGRPHYLQRAA